MQAHRSVSESKDTKESDGIAFSIIDHELRILSRSLFSARSKCQEYISGLLNYSRKLLNYKNIRSVINLLQNRSKIVVLTGAGISVSSGIPDFRSSQGVYARLKEEHPELHRPEDMFSLPFFRSDPRPFFTFAKEIFPGQFIPSFTHRFIRSLERQSKLLRNYTQNIDTLEQVAGISNVVYCHGKVRTRLDKFEFFWLFVFQFNILYFSSRILCYSILYPVWIPGAWRRNSRSNIISAHPLLPKMLSGSGTQGHSCYSF